MIVFFLDYFSSEESNPKEPKSVECISSKTSFPEDLIRSEKEVSFFMQSSQPRIPPPPMPQLSRSHASTSVLPSKVYPPAFSNNGSGSVQYNLNKSKFPHAKRPAEEYPRLPTHQSTLPLELQNLTAKEVYPNLHVDSSPKDVPNEESDLVTKPENIPQKEIKSNHKRIIWNKGAPENPFSFTHQYTREPGAW